MQDRLTSVKQSAALVCFMFTSNTKLSGDDERRSDIRRCLFHRALNRTTDLLSWTIHFVCNRLGLTVSKVVP